MDNISNTGVYAISGTPNLLFHMTWDNNFMTQIRNSIDGTLFYRTKSAGTWHEWEKLIDNYTFSDLETKVNNLESKFNNLSTKYASHSHVELLSPSKTYRLSMQDDRNLVVYKTSDNSVIFATNNLFSQSGNTLTINY